MGDKVSTLVAMSRKLIQKKLGLNSLPGITISVRAFSGPDRRGRYHLEGQRAEVDESGELMRDSTWFNRGVQEFRDSYIQLYRDTKKDIPFQMYLVEPLVRMGKVTISGGINWIIIGTLKNGEKYAAIQDVEVRPMFRGCRLMTLLKDVELSLARKKRCDFIQTWHWIDNPYLIGAIVPSLKAGFILYRGSEKDGDMYEDHGCIHLRYYFNRKKIRNVRVWLKGRTMYESPKNNDEIISQLISFPHNPGMQIIRIENYEPPTKK